jgi:hypothetical protein
MKWIVLILLTLCCTACIYSSNKLVEYREVYTAPTVDPVIKEEEELPPLDVTHTRVFIY